MAKKKTAAKRRSPRRRRVGAISSGIGTVGLAIAGAVLGRTVFNVLTKVNETTGKSMLDRMPAAALVTLAGFSLTKFIKSPMGYGAGIGMAAAGGLNLAQGLGVLNGIDSLTSGQMVAGYLTNGISQGSNNMVAGMEPGMGMVGAIIDEC